MNDTTENLGQAISALVVQTLTPDFIETTLRGRIEKLMIESIDSALRSYSPAGKAINAAVKASLQVNKLDLPSYGQAVTAMVREQLERRVEQTLAARLAADLDELLCLAPKEIKLSKIVSDMIEQHKDDHGPLALDRVTAIIDDSDYSSTWVYLDDNDKHSEREKHSCEVSMLIRQDGTIACANINGRDITKSKRIGSDWGISQLVRSMYACGTIITIDRDEVENALSTDY